MEKEEDKIELRSEEFQEVLGYIPPWILRWGITVLGIIVLVLLIGSAVFKYPDIISSSVVLTGSTPPAAVVANSTGKIREFFVADNQQVNEGDFLAVIDNPASTQDVFYLKKYLETLHLDNDSAWVLPPKELILGNFQSQFSSFYITLFEYLEFKRLRYHASKAGILQERLLQYQKLYNNTIQQQQVTREQLLIARKQFQRDSLMYVKGLISQEVYENAEVQRLQSLLSYQNIGSSLDNMEIQIAQCKESLFETEFQYIERENNFKSQLRAFSVQMQNEIQSWELSYMLCSPINGKITFTNYWTVNQNITAGSVAFNVIPAEEVELIGKASLPVLRSGKVKLGQKVNIRFDNFPDHEYGIVRGQIKNISLVPVNDNGTVTYTVEVELPDGLETSYRRQLPYLPGMQGQADIITEDITLLERFIMPVRKILNEGLRN